MRKLDVKTAVAALLFLYLAVWNFRLHSEVKRLEAKTLELRERLDAAQLKNIQTTAENLTRELRIIKKRINERKRNHYNFSGFPNDSLHQLLTTPLDSIERMFNKGGGRTFIGRTRPAGRLHR